MSFAEELKMKRDSFLDEKAIQFAEKMELKIIKEAEMGHLNITVQVDNDMEDKHVYRSHEFAEKLQELLDGVKVTYEVQTYQSLLKTRIYKHYLRFDWSDPA